MKKGKRFQGIAGCAAVVLSVALLAACGGSGKTSPAEKPAAAGTAEKAKAERSSAAGSAGGGKTQASKGSGTESTAVENFEAEAEAQLTESELQATYTLKFDGGNGALGSQKEETFTLAEEPKPLPAGTTFSRPEHNFKHWSTKPNGAAAQIEEVVQLLKTGRHESLDLNGTVITIHAVWEEEPWQVEKIGMRMIGVPGGTVAMASNYAPALSAFKMSQTEITQRQWQAIVGNEGFGSNAERPSEMYGKGADFPMYYVSWYDAVVFCNKLSVKAGKRPCYTKNGSTDTDSWGLPPSVSDAGWNGIACNFGADGYRLPTEAEWEYAARGGSEDKFSVFSGTTGYDLTEVGWYNANSNGKTNRVNTKKDNKNQIKDMSGNVWEWCWDWYASAYVEEKTNPTGAASGAFRVARGGCWDDSATDCSVYLRHHFLQYGRNNFVGFRVVSR